MLPKLPNIKTEWRFYLKWAGFWKHNTDYIQLLLLRKFFRLLHNTVFIFAFHKVNP